MTDEAGEWTEEARAEFDQKNAELQADWSQAVATGLTDTLDEALRPKFAQVVAKLAEPVLVGSEVVASGDARMYLTSGPVAQETAGIQQRVQYSPVGGERRM